MQLRIATAIVSGGMSLLLALTTLLWIFAIGGKGWLGVAPLSNSIRSTLSLVILLTSCTSDRAPRFLVSQGHRGINQAAWVGTVVMLGRVSLGAQSGRNGAVAVAQGMILGVMIGVGYLFYSWRSLNEYCRRILKLESDANYYRL